MKSFVHFGRVAPVMLALTVFVLPGTADEDRPWKGTGSGVETAEGAAFAGQCSHLGASTGVLTLEFFEPGVFAGTGILTAADGDEVHFDWVLLFPVTGPETDIPFTGTFTVVGGTGRFAAATGSADVAGIQDYPGGPSNFTWEGTLSY